jgi:hypothetical protein
LVTPGGLTKGEWSAERGRNRDREGEAERQRSREAEAETETETATETETETEAEAGPTDGAGVRPRRGDAVRVFDCSGVDRELTLPVCPRPPLRPCDCVTV